MNKISKERFEEMKEFSTINISIYCKCGKLMQEYEYIDGMCLSCKIDYDAKKLLKKVISIEKELTNQINMLSIKYD